MKNTMTYANAINTILTSETLTNEVRETMERLLESINKRNTRKATNTKPTKKQVENEGIKEQIRAILREATEPMTCKAVAEQLGVSAQKVNAMFIQMNKAGEIAKSEGKRKVSLFALANIEG